MEDSKTKFVKKIIRMDPDYNVYFKMYMKSDNGLKQYNCILGCDHFEPVKYVPTVIGKDILDIEFPNKVEITDIVDLSGVKGIDVGDKLDCILAIGERNFIDKVIEVELIIK